MLRLCPTTKKLYQQVAEKEEDLINFSLLNKTSTDVGHITKSYTHLY